MEIEVDKTYILVIDVNGKTLTYTCKILNIDVDGDISFIDKYGEKLSYNKRYIVSSKEVKE